VAIADRLSWPYRLDQVLVVMDGEPILRFEDRADPSPTAVDLQLPAGVHTIAVQVIAALPSGSIGRECLVRLRTSHSFGAGHEPMSILLVPHLGQQTAGFAERLQLEIRFRGTRPIAEVEHLPRPADRACADTSGVERRLCLAADRVAEARRQRDVIALACRQEKLERMREIAAAGAEAAAEEIERLWLELENCAGCPKYEFGSRTERMAHSEGCGEIADPFADPRL
jgi:hypothetical protein